MLIAVTGKDEAGRKLLILGLQEENVTRMLNDEPVYKSLRPYGLEEWDVMILGPEDTARLMAEQEARVARGEVGITIERDKPKRSEG